MSEPWEEDRTRPYPPWVRGDEAERRWRLVTCAALITYGFERGDQLDSGDRALIWHTQRAFYASEHETGDGDLNPDQTVWLMELGLV